MLSSCYSSGYTMAKDGLPSSVTPTNLSLHPTIQAVWEDSFYSPA